jgi:hypothetical protein
MSNGRVIFRGVDRLVDWKRAARLCIDGHDRPFRLVALSGQPPKPEGGTPFGVPGLTARARAER